VLDAGGVAGRSHEEGTTGLHIPGQVHRGIAVVRLRGVLTQIDTGRLNALRRRILAADPQLVITDPG
jgi:hypothetical protein